MTIVVFFLRATDSGWQGLFTSGSGEEELRRGGNRRNDLRCERMLVEGLLKEVVDLRQQGLNLRHGKRSFRMHKLNSTNMA